MKMIWIFNGALDAVWLGPPAGVFLDKASAVEWIEEHKLTGILTEFPVGTGVYEYARAQGWLKRELSSREIGLLTSASLDHAHFQDGKEH